MKWDELPFLSLVVSIRLARWRNDEIGSSSSSSSRHKEVQRGNIAVFHLILSVMYDGVWQEPFFAATDSILRAPRLSLACQPCFDENRDNH